MDGFMHHEVTNCQLLAIEPQTRIEPRPGLIARVLDLLALWRRRARERQELARLGDRDLSDIGLSRGDIYNELSKPFWRE